MPSKSSTQMISQVPMGSEWFFRKSGVNATFSMDNGRDTYIYEIILWDWETKEDYEIVIYISAHKNRRVYYCGWEVVCEYKTWEKRENLIKRLIAINRPRVERNFVIRLKQKLSVVTRRWWQWNGLLFLVNQTRFTKSLQLNAFEPTFLTLQLISRMEVLRTSSLVDRSWRGGVAGEAWLKRSGKTLFRVPRLLFSLPRF